MGNTVDIELKTNSFMFAQSVESSYITCDMVIQMIERWNANGRPIFMGPKDFKERILTSDMDQEVKLNYLKWLTQGMDIDMFEILSVLTLYSRSSITARFRVLFKIFCIQEDEQMLIDEFRFCMGKLATSVGATLTIKKTILHELVKISEPRLVPDQMSLSEEEFVLIMMKTFRVLIYKLNQYKMLLDSFNASTSKHRLPNYLRPGQVLLGKYKIEFVMPHADILKLKAYQYPSVFMSPKFQEESARSSEKSTRTKRTRPAAQSRSKSKGNTSSKGSNLGGNSQRGGSVAGDIQIHDDPNDDANEDMYAVGQNYLTLYNVNYVYRLKANAIYEQGRVYIFDVFNVQQDAKLAQFQLFENIWKETLILSQVNDPRLPTVISFGQLPEGIIYREIEENHGYSLEEYIKEKETSMKIKQKSLLTSQAQQYQSNMSAQEMTISQDQSSESLIPRSQQKSIPTFFTEVETIDICLKIIDLLELIHEQNVVHTNLCPAEIFLRDKKLNHMQFHNLYHCTGNAKQQIGFQYVESQAYDISRFDARTRSEQYISPEQVQIGHELMDIAMSHNGRIDVESQSIQDFMQENAVKISHKCDLYSLGAILYRCLLGQAPTLKISSHISKKRLQEHSPEANIYDEPYFVKGKVLSNQMCKILVHLLHEDPKHRYEDLDGIKQALLGLRKNIFSTPKILRELLRHPVLPGEVLEPVNTHRVIDFKNKDMNKFSLKYLAKFICEVDAETVSINGGHMPIRQIQLNQLVELNLRDQGLYSEDLFVLAQVLKDNTSLEHINLSKNMIGFTYVDERSMLEIKLRNQDKLQEATFDKLFYDSLGLEHFSLAFKNTNRIKHLDISENDIGSENFMILMPIFESNTSIQNLNVADCNLDGYCAQALCSILKQQNNQLERLMFRNSELGEVGALAIADLIRGHMSMVLLEIFNCGIDEAGGNAIGNALKTNFCIEKLSIGENILNQRDVEQIKQSVLFNTQYNQMKEANKKFEGFAHNLIAESLKRWATQSNFVADKLKERLKNPLDDLDQKISEVMFDRKGHMDLKPTPQEYEYKSGDGQIQIGKKPKIQ